jgi:hypothetical protein
MEDTMSKTEIAKLVAQFAANGGEVKVLAPSRKRFKTWRGKSGAWAKGAKKVGLQDRNFAS